MLVQIEEGYKKYTVDGVEVRAKKLMPGGGFYLIILPNGKRIRHLTAVFEATATPVKETKDGNSVGD